MPVYRMWIEYEGTPFRGWQIQDHQPTVQGALEEALKVALREPVRIIGSGRTDTGVHARGQVAHFHTSQPVDTEKLKRSLNALTPREIAIRHIEPVAEDFHARYDARRRRYHYYISTEPRALDRHMRWFVQPAPDVERMNQAARHLLGTHDFSAFCRTQSETKNRVCTVEVARWVPEKRPGDWRFEIVADRFLHGMVRAIVGTLIEIGQGKRPEDDILRILASRDRREAGPAAPPHGLVLESVEYAS